MGSSGKKIASIATFGMSDVVSGNKPFGAFSSKSGGSAGVTVAGLIGKKVLQEQTADTNAVAARRSRTQTVFSSPLGIGGMANMARKYLLGQ